MSVNTFDVLDAKCVPKFASARDLRDKLRLDADAQVLFVSVRDDTYLESFWKHLTRDRLEALAALDLLGITVPNFSFFDDAPRTHTMRNLWRIIRTAEDFADAGLRPILHLNATLEEDWTNWSRILRESPQSRYVCKEFHTGLQDPERAVAAIESLAALQDSVQQELHVVAVAARRLIPVLVKHFNAFTVIDSVPFMASISRKRLHVAGISIREIDNPTPAGAPIDDLLFDNVIEYGKLVRTACKVGAQRILPDLLPSDDTELEALP